MQLVRVFFFFFPPWMVANLSMNKRKQNCGINCKKLALGRLEKLDLLCVQLKQRSFLGACLAHLCSPPLVPFLGQKQSPDVGGTQ